MSLEVVNKAREKIEKEHKEFKKEIEKLKPMDVYRMAGMIIFTEATIYHLNQLTSSSELCELINKQDASLKGCINHIISKVKQKYGLMGDLPVNEFHELIWDYFKIDHAAAKKAMEEKMKKAEEARKNLRSNSNQKKKKDNQINLMEVLNKKSDNQQDSKDKDNTPVTVVTPKENTKTSLKAGPLQVSLFDFGGSQNE